jgi:hypothetical protein
MLAKSGVREWLDPAANEQLWLAAIAAANGLLEIIPVDPDEEANVALPDYFKCGAGTAKTIKNSGGTAAITLASLANGNGTSAGGRQAATLDLGALWAQWWRIDTDFELAATPTAGNAINLYGSFAPATGAGRGNTSGSDAAYTGYSNNIDAAAKHLEFLGSHVCTAQATSTVQKASVGLIFPKGQYLNVVVDNRSGAAFHSTDTNQVITLTPLEFSLEDTV